MRSRRLRIPDDELHALGVFNRSGINYLLIGGVAMCFYGANRDFSDVDIFVANSPWQAAALFTAIGELAGKPPAFRPQDLEAPRKRVSLRGSGYEIDILTSFIKRAAAGE